MVNEHVYLLTRCGAAVFQSVAYSGECRIYVHVSRYAFFIKFNIANRLIRNPYDIFLFDHAYFSQVQAQRTYLNSFTPIFRRYCTRFITSSPAFVISQFSCTKSQRYVTNHFFISISYNFNVPVSFKHALPYCFHKKQHKFISSCAFVNKTFCVRTSCKKLARQHTLFVLPIRSVLIHLIQLTLEIIDVQRAYSMIYVNTSFR